MYLHNKIIAFNDASPKLEKVLDKYCNPEYKHWESTLYETVLYGIAYRFRENTMSLKLAAIDCEYLNFINSHLLTVLNHHFKDDGCSMLEVGANKDPIFLILKYLDFKIDNCTFLEAGIGLKIVSSLLKKSPEISILDNTTVIPLNKRYNLVVYMGPEVEFEVLNTH